MARFPGNGELQTRGCGAIYALALSNKGTQAALCVAGAAGAVLGALQRFMHDPAVVISAADAIMSLACDYRRGQDLLGEGPGGGAKGACELLAEMVARCVRRRGFVYVCVCGSVCSPLRGVVRLSPSSCSLSLPPLPQPP